MSTTEPTPTADPLQLMLDTLYRTMDGSETAMRYGRRHGIKSASILTVTDDDRAAMIACHLAPRIEGKTVVEIGAGIGLLALHLSEYAARVFAIEANPAWSHVFVQFLYANKPKHVSYLFGAAQEFSGWLRADVAIFCTHSDHKGMREVAGLFAPVVIDVYDELVGTVDEEMLIPSLADAERVWGVK